MELPGILKQMVTGPGQGLIELCPNEYDVSNIGEMLADVLAECEQLALEGIAEPADD